MKLKLITTKNYSGYSLENIRKVLGDKNFSEFEKWMFGETVGIYKGKTLVYKHDYIRFMAGCTPSAF